MHSDTLYAALKPIISPTGRNDWEIEEIANRLKNFPSPTKKTIVNQIQAIWPVSHPLCMSFLDNVQNALSCLSADQLNDWVNATLAIYEHDGLHKARLFLADVEKTYLCRIRGELGLPLESVKPRLLAYLHGLSGQTIDIAPSSDIYTDGVTIYVPSEISLFTEREKNFLIYKLIITFQWLLTAHGTYTCRFDPEDTLITNLRRRYDKPENNHQVPIENFLHLFPDPILARDLYHLAEATWVMAILKRHFSGLIQDISPLLPQLYQDKSTRDHALVKTRAMLALHRWSLDLGQLDDTPQSFADCISILTDMQDTTSTSHHAAHSTAELYDIFETIGGKYIPIQPVLFYGQLRLDLFSEIRNKREEKLKQQFVEAIRALVPETIITSAQDEIPLAEGAAVPSASDTEVTLMIPPGTGDKKSAPTDVKPARQIVIINEQVVEIPDSMRDLLASIRTELGAIPESFIASAQGVGGKGAMPMQDSGYPADTSQQPISQLLYDEWDFRRGGYRKQWCHLQQKEINPVRGTFVQETLRKHRGVLLQIRKSFEMMRSRDQIAKRQRDGDDIDLDATIDAMNDIKAGRVPSEKLFTRLIRNDRNIAAVFLVDMSSSTEGWVGTTIKESLVLMCEALEVLGDRYGIYGFSGMRRLRSELFHIKHLDEPYDAAIKGKIAAIQPQDYTRIGPPIRHLTKMLSETEARVKLLITLSDGKPEDYDDYKGEYAIEDTKHALIEAKAAGVHPFCITIDKEAHDYIARMYGQVNYIFINDVRLLPSRLPEVYRTLTT